MKRTRASINDERTHQSWGFFTHHAHVLTQLVIHPLIPLREVAVTLGITERSVQSIVKDLESAGFVQRTKRGRINCYTISTNTQLHHHLEGHKTVAELLRFLKGSSSINDRKSPSSREQSLSESSGHTSKISITLR